jgi:D-galactarolactone cycloisomerase
MKIVAVTAIPMTHSELGKPIKYMHEFPANHLFVRLDTDEGIVGYGEVSDGYGCNYPLTTKALIDEGLSPMLLGEDAAGIGRLVVKMRGWTRRELCDQGLIIQAISGVEIALWDLLGKAQGKAICDLFGRFHSSIPVYASGTFLQEGTADWHFALFEPCLERGVRALKVRIGPVFRPDLATLAGLRKLLGDDIDILVDGAEHFSVPSALEIAKALADLNVMLFEEPVPQHSRDGIAFLVEHSPLPISYGEHLFTTHDFHDWLSHRRANIVQPDAAISGGIAECRKIAAIAESFGAPVIPHTADGPVVVAANLHFAASVPNVKMLEYPFTLDRLWREMLKQPILSPGALQNGRLPVPDGPGLGLTIDEDIWARHPYKSRERVVQMPTWSMGHA